jgi:hypothetical protein
MGGECEEPEREEPEEDGGGEAEDEDFQEFSHVKM